MEQVRVATYYRVSKADGSMHLGNQEPEVRALCKARGWPIVREFREMDSGIGRRPVFQDALLRLARNGDIDVVVAWSLDRVARGFRCFDAYRTLASYGVRLVTVREPWTDASGPAQDLLVAVMAFVSGFERERLVERTRAGLDRARRQGRRIGRPPVVVDVAAALRMRGSGTSVRLIAQKMKCGETTLRRILAASDQSEQPSAASAKTGAGEGCIQAPDFPAAA